MVVVKRIGEIRIGRRVYDLDIWEPHHGSTDIEPRNRRRLVVNDHVETDEWWDTLYHELFHAVSDTYSLNLSHKQIEKLAKYCVKLKKEME